MAMTTETTWTCDVKECDATVVQHQEYSDLPDDWVSVSVPAASAALHYSRVTKHFCGAEHAGTYLTQRHADKLVFDAVQARADANQEAWRRQHTRPSPR